MAIHTFTKNDIDALANRLDRHSVAINIPQRMATDCRSAALVIRKLFAELGLQAIRVEDNRS